MTGLILSFNHKSNKEMRAVGEGKERKRKGEKKERRELYGVFFFGSRNCRGVEIRVAITCVVL